MKKVLKEVAAVLALAAWFLFGGPLVMVPVPLLLSPEVA